ncbi:hypothetical protein [Archaeoglobus veneficus]|nr:hypothetical protein [Archaeoglobus veneficus]
MGWRYRHLRSELKKLEPRRTYAIPLSALRPFKRGDFTAREAVNAVRRAARNMNAEVYVRGEKIYIRLRPSCACNV